MNQLTIADVQLGEVLADPQELFVLWAVHVRLRNERLSADGLRELVRDARAGAIVIFEGVTREVPELEYEAYAEMAEAKMREIAVSLERADPPLRMALHHRVGDLAIGDVAVVVAAAAPHRDAAFVAARAAIDELKRVVPIWKKEFTDDGAVWIEDHA